MSLGRGYSHSVIRSKASRGYLATSRSGLRRRPTPKMPLDNAVPQTHVVRCACLSMTRAGQRHLVSAPSYNIEHMPPHAHSKQVVTRETTHQIFGLTFSMTLNQTCFVPAAPKCHASPDPMPRCFHHARTSTTSKSPAPPQQPQHKWTPYASH
jgi:hypothetical protein